MSPPVDSCLNCIILFLMAIASVKAAELPQLINEGHTVIDVRTPFEYRSEHAVGTELSPLNQLDAKAFCEHNDVGFPVYILCQSSRRGLIAAEKLEAAGHQNVYVVEGGIDAAKQAGIEIEYGGGGLSVERQRCIAAGSLALIGTALGVSVHDGFFALPALLGVTLLLAGITDHCGRPTFLARMPWNR